MKILQRIKNYASISIISKIEIKKPNKTDWEFYIESLTKDGDIVSTRSENISATDIKKLVTLFETKMKKCAYLNDILRVSKAYDLETILFINPELMEKERVGFEFYGPVSDKNVNANICAYYSFGDAEPDYRQELTHDEVFGFFRLSNFESPAGSFKATLNELGVTYVLIEGTVNNMLFLTDQEYKRQFKKEVVKEPKKRQRKTDTLDKEIKEMQEAVLKSIKETKVEEPVKIAENPPVKRGRGRPPKNIK